MRCWVLINSADFEFLVDVMYACYWSLLAFACMFIAASCVVLFGGCFSWLVCLGVGLSWRWFGRVWFGSLTDASWFVALLLCGCAVFGGLSGC